MRKIILFFSLLVLFGCSEGNKSNNAEKIQDLVNRAKEFSSKSDYNSAIACYNEIISLDSANADRYDERANFYRYVFYKDTTNQQLAFLELKDLNKAIVLNATTKRYTARAEYWERHKNFDKALTDYNFAVGNKTAENNWDTLKERAKFYFYTLKDSSHAFADIKEAIHLAQQDDKYTESEASLNSEYAEMLMECRKFSLAEEILVDVMERCANKNFSLFWLPMDLAECRIELGDFLGALIQIENCTKSEYQQILKGYCLVKLNQREYGMDLMKRNGLRSWNKPLVGRGDYGDCPPTRFINKYYLEYFPKSEDQLKGTEISNDYNWPN